MESVLDFMVIVSDIGASIPRDIKPKNRQPLFHLRNIAKIRYFWAKFEAEKLIHAFIASRLNYCNALLSGYLDKPLNKLQLVLNRCVGSCPVEKQMIVPLRANQIGWCIAAESCDSHAG
jgi:hypothetical protein